MKHVCLSSRRSSDTISAPVVAPSSPGKSKLAGIGNRENCRGTYVFGCKPESRERPDPSSQRADPRRASGKAEGRREVDGSQERVRFAEGGAPEDGAGKGREGRGSGGRRRGRDRRGSRGWREGRCGSRERCCGSG